MNRPIKFRAILNKEARVGYDKYQTDIILFSLEDLMRGKVVFAYPEHWQFDRWTGLKDKNGKDVFEGDVLQAVYPNRLEPLMRKRGERYEVVFRLGAFKAFDLASKEGDIEDSFLHAKAFGREHLEGYEIIGNIFENPELIK